MAGAAAEDSKAPGNVQRTALEKELLKFEKKLREVDKLQQLVDGGESIEKLQRDKLAKREELCVKVEELKEQCALEAIEREKALNEPPPAKDAIALAETRKKFDAVVFEGDWLDNFGQRLLVAKGKTRKGQRKGTWITYTYSVRVQRGDGFDKRLTLLYDSDLQEWRCGNAQLQREVSDAETISWKSSNGRSSTWTRTPPDGPIYFDAPPGGYGPALAAYGEFDSAYGEFDSAYGDYGEYEAKAGNYDDSWISSGYGADYSNTWGDNYGPAWSEWTPAQYSYSSAAKVEATEPADERDEFTNTLLGALLDEDDSGGQDPTEDVAELPTPDKIVGIHVSGNRVDWTIPDSWDNLRWRPKDSQISSDLFDVVGCTGMQLDFFPNGTKLSEDGFCTIQLTRGPQNRGGIKFELRLNGRCNGPKACMGRRFLTDYPRPSGDNCAGSDAQQIIVSFVVVSSI